MRLSSGKADHGGKSAGKADHGGQWAAGTRLPVSPRTDRNRNKAAPAIGQVRGQSLGWHA